MKRFLSLVLVLMLCVGTVAFAEADPVEATAEPTPAPTPTPAPADSPTGNADREPDVEPTPTPVPVVPVVEIEGATVEVAPQIDIDTLILNVQQNAAQMFGVDSDVYKEIDGKPLMGATIVTIEFTALEVDQPQTITSDLPVGFNLQEGDKVTIVVGIKDSYGVYVYNVIHGTVVKGKIEFQIDYATAMAMSGAAKTQMIFYKG